MFGWFRWANKDKDFLDVSMFDSNLSWKAFFQGGRKVKPMKTPSWISPSAGLLKLIFDGSFLKELRKGGFGGVTRDSLDTPLCTYSGSLIVYTPMRQRCLLCWWDAMGYGSWGVITQL